MNSVNSDHSLNVLAKRLSSGLRPISAERRIVRVKDKFAGDLVVTTSFGPTSAVLLHMASTIFPGIRVVHVRHGYETPETLKFAGECQKRFDIDLRVYEAPKRPVPEFGSVEFDAFCKAVKVEPMRQALAAERARAWLAGLVHDENIERRGMAMVQVRLGALAIYPILDWVLRDAMMYCETFNLDLNTDYYDPCKGPEQKLECGLHSTR